MKILGLIMASTVLLSIDPAAMAGTVTNNLLISQTTVKMGTDATGDQIQYTSVGIYRSDLSRPHILRVQGLANNVAVPMERVDVKLNGKVVKSIANSSLEVNLAPLMTVGRYEVEVSGTTRQNDATISLNFAGANTQVNQQSSGSGKIKQKLVITVY
jgi:hypothetical protein